MIDKLNTIENKLRNPWIFHDNTPFASFSLHSIHASHFFQLNCPNPISIIFKSPCLSQWISPLVRSPSNHVGGGYQKLKLTTWRLGSTGCSPLKFWKFFGRHKTENRLFILLCFTAGVGSLYHSKRLRLWTLLILSKSSQTVSRLTWSWLMLYEALCFLQFF